MVLLTLVEDEAGGLAVQLAVVVLFRQGKGHYRPPRGVSHKEALAQALESWDYELGGEGEELALETFKEQRTPATFVHVTLHSRCGYAQKRKS